MPAVGVSTTGTALLTVTLALGLACAPAPPEVAAPAPSPPRPSAAGTVPVAPPPAPAPPAESTAPPATSEPKLPDPYDAVVSEVFASSIERAWTSSAGTFVLTARTRPAVEHAAVLRYPQAAKEAATGGRVVTMAEVWTVRAGTLVNVMRRPIGLRPMVCDADEGCEIVERGARVTEAGAVAINPGNCAAALAALRPAAGPGATVFDV